MMNEKYDLVEAANHAGNFRVFLQALETAGLKKMLKDRGPYTVLAPVDDAFLKLPRAQLHVLFNARNRESLRSMLENHIIVQKLLSTDLQRRDTIRSMTDEDLVVDSRSELSVNGAQIITADVEASNGVLHSIDAVLMPQPQVAAAR